MNLILFEPAETERPLPRTDRRAAHLLEVLRRQPGDSFDVGLINGPRGKATVEAITSHAIALRFVWSDDRPILDPITLIVGLPRPQTARDILRDATTLGVVALHFVRTEKSDANYAQSTLWTSGEWRRHLLAGAEQAFDTRIPEISHTQTLADLASSLAPSPLRVALDNYESPGRLGDFDVAPGQSLILAIGGERGWSAADRTTLRAHRFTFAHLGPRVLRTETAAVAALSIVRTKLGLM